jgi:hypothetical protein
MATIQQSGSCGRCRGRPGTKAFIRRRVADWQAGFPRGATNKCSYVQPLVLLALPLGFENEAPGSGSPRIATGGASESGISGGASVGCSCLSCVITCGVGLTNGIARRADAALDGLPAASGELLPQPCFATRWATGPCSSCYHADWAYSHN